MEQVWDMDIPSPGGVDGGGSNIVGRDLRHMSSEHLCTIYRDNAYNGTMYGGGAASRGEVF